jgi:hypothetical protein
LVNAEMLTNAMQAASTETVPMRWREKVRPSMTLLGRNQLTPLLEACDQQIIANLLVTPTFATNNDAAANSLALELYCYWKPEAPCVGCEGR